MINELLISALRGALDSLGVDAPDVIGLERPARREHGDWSSNVALASAKAAGRNPRELGTQLAELLDANPPLHVAKVEVAGPGFVNFFLADSWLHDVLREVAEAGADGYARQVVGHDTPVIVEFVSANPTGPLHAGHARGACYGDAVARLLERVGHPVQREFYINDRGTQMQTFARSLAARRAGDAPPEDGYHGQYVIDWAAELPADADPLEWGYARALADQREVLASMRVEFDTWFSERDMVAAGAIDAALADLGQHGVVYTEDGAVWLRSTDYGDDKDRVLVKSDGEYTYLLPDIAYHRDKFSRATRLIDVWGADHHGYVPRMKAAMQALGHDPDELDVRITQLVRLERDGEEVRLSKRTGDIVEVRDIVEEIGADAMRFTYLIQSIDSPQTFDLALAAKQGMDNPVYYVQMAHARLCSIQAKVAEAGIPRLALADVDLGRLVHDRELEVLRQLSELPEVVLLAARERGPHKVVAWLRDYAAAVHGFYHDCYVMGDGVEPELTQARLWLVEAARVGLVIGLDLLGVSAPESM
ncbi:MAG: arginine--tRNA ligase [Acidimicrobiales bacterium]|nr:arginine--tRNA ligase [Acidimicrobiales bacterium]